MADFGKPNDFKKNTPIPYESIIPQDVVEELEKTALERLAQLASEERQAGRLGEIFQNALKEVTRNIAEEIAKKYQLPETRVLRTSVEVMQSLEQSYLHASRIIPPEQLGKPESIREFLSLVGELSQARRAYSPRVFEEITQYLAAYKETSGKIPENVGEFINTLALQQQIAKEPVKAARRFLAGDLNLEQLGESAPVAAFMGPSIRREFQEALRTRDVTRELPLSDTVRSYVLSRTEDIQEKAREYLDFLNKTFERLARQLQNTQSEEKAKELKEALDKVSKEIVQTTKTLEEAAKEEEQRRRELRARLGQALAPIGRHAEGALQSPLTGLISESIRTGAAVAEAVSQILSTDTGGGVGFFPVGDPRGLLRRAGDLAKRAGRGLFNLGKRVLGRGGLYGIAAGIAIEEALDNRDWFANQLSENAWNIALSRNNQELARQYALQDIEAFESGRLKPEAFLARYQNVFDLFAQKGINPEDFLGTDVFKKLTDSVKEAESAINELSDSTKKASGGLNLLQMALGGTALAGIGLAALGIRNPVAEVSKDTLAMAAGVGAGLVNMYLGAVDIGQGILGEYYQGTTGLNIRQFLEFSGGVRNVNAAVRQGVFGGEAIQLGFSEGEILRGYEAMQRRMPTGEMGLREFRESLDYAARTARLFGVRLEETIQTQALMRATFGPGAQNEFTGMVAALGADRTGRWEQAFSKAMADALIAAARQQMLQGVRPEEGARGFGIIRQLFMQEGMPDYLRTLFETNPQAVLNVSQTFGGIALAGVRGQNPWALGLGFRAGLSIEQMARGGPEVALRMMEQIAQEIPLGPGGTIGRAQREYLSMLAAQLGLNPDILIEFIRAYQEGGLEAARARYQELRTAGERPITVEEVRRSPYEDQLRQIRRQRQLLSETTEEVVDTIAAINEKLYNVMGLVLRGGNHFMRVLDESYETVKEYLRNMNINIEETGTETVSQGTVTPPTSSAPAPKKEVSAKESKVQPDEVDKYLPQFMQKYTTPVRQLGGAQTVVIKTSGPVEIYEEPVSFEPEE